MAFLIALALTAIFGLLGFFLKQKIWDPSKIPSTPQEYGRKFAAYMVFISTLSSMHFFIKDDLPNAAVKYLITVTIFPVISYLFGLLFGWIKFRGGSAISSEKDFTNTNRHTSGISINNQTLFLVATIFIVGFAYYYFVDKADGKVSKSQNWVPIAKMMKHSWDENQKTDVYQWIDLDSIRKNGNLTSGFIGGDIGKRLEKGEIFRRMKIESDCALRKFRYLEEAYFDKGPAEGLGNLIREDKNFLKTHAMEMMKAFPNYINTGDWINEAEELADFEKWSRTPSNGKDNGVEVLRQYAEINLVIIKYLCD